MKGIELYMYQNLMLKIYERNVDCNYTQIEKLLRKLNKSVNI